MNAPSPNTPDRVQLTERGATRQMTLEQFLAIEVTQQVEHLFRGNVRFFSGETEIRALDALKAMRSQSKRAG